jgi:hypothetical protein
MDAEIQQLVEMVRNSPWSTTAVYLHVYLPSRQGATHAQARAALRQYKDVMQAAERFFEGKFDHIEDEDEDVEMASHTSELRSFRPSVNSLYKKLGLDRSKMYHRHQMMMRV